MSRRRKGPEVVIMTWMAAKRSWSEMAYKTEICPHRRAPDPQPPGIYLTNASQCLQPPFKYSVRISPEKSSNENQMLKMLKIIIPYVSEIPYCGLQGLRDIHRLLPYTPQDSGT